MTREELLDRVIVDLKVCTGKPCIRGTRIYIAIILDALAEGLSPEEIIDHPRKSSWTGWSVRLWWCRARRDDAE